MAINWSEKYAINVGEIDSQHEYFVSLINNMQNALFSGEIESTVDNTLAQLVDYSRQHFTTEESLLEDAGLANLLARQRKEHTDLLAKLDKFLAERDLDRPRLPLYYDLVTFLKMWLIDHLEGIDRECGFALNAKGVY